MAVDLPSPIHERSSAAEQTAAKRTMSNNHDHNRNREYFYDNHYFLWAFRGGKGSKANTRPSGAIRIYFDYFDRFRSGHCAAYRRPPTHFSLAIVAHRRGRRLRPPRPPATADDTWMCFEVFIAAGSCCVILMSIIAPNERRCGRNNI